MHLNLRVPDRNNRTGCQKTGKGYPGRGPVLWTSRFLPVFEDDHFESRRRVRGLSTWALEAVRLGFRDPALMSSSCMTLRKLMILSKMQFPHLQIGVQWYISKSLLARIK